MSSGTLDARFVEPTAEFFPDPFVPGDDASAVTLAQRIFEYAGLADVAVTLERAWFAPTRRRQPALQGGDNGVDRDDDRTGPARLLRLGECECVVGVDATDPATLAAALCRVAARVFVERAPESYRDAPIRDVTTTQEALRAAELASVYLGFGIVTTNDAYHFSRHGRVVVHRTCGVLSYDAMAVALASFWRLRGTISRALRKSAMMEA